MNCAVSSVFGAFIFTFLIASNATANANTNGYQVPSTEFARFVEVQTTPDILMSPNND